MIVDNEKGGAQNKFLKKAEQTALVGKLKTSYEEIIHVLDQLV